MSKQVELKQYIKRRRQGQNVRVGVMYAQVIPDGSGKVAIGFSLCSKADQFCPYTGDDIAFLRSITYMERSPYCAGPNCKNVIPDSISQDLAVFIGRVERFFKEHILPEWATQYYIDHKAQVDSFFLKLDAKKKAESAKKAQLAPTCQSLADILGEYYEKKESEEVANG